MAPPVPTEGASSLGPRVEGPITPDELPTSEPMEAAHSEELVFVQRRRPPEPPGFNLSLADESQPTPSRGCSLANKHTPGSPIGCYLIGVPVGDCLSLPSNGGSLTPLSNLGPCPDFPTTDPVQILYQPDSPLWIEEL